MGFCLQDLVAGGSDTVAAALVCTMTVLTVDEGAFVNEEVARGDKTDGRKERCGGA